MGDSGSAGRSYFQRTKSGIRRFHHRVPFGSLAGVSRTRRMQIISTIRTGLTNGSVRHAFRQGVPRSRRAVEGVAGHGPARAASADAMRASGLGRHLIRLGHDPRAVHMALRRLRGETFETIGRLYGLSRQRAHQMVASLEEDAERYLLHDGGAIGGE